MSSTKTLEISEHYLRSGLARHLHSPRQERSLAHLTRPFDQHNAISALDSREELIICWPNDVELGIKRDGATNRLQLAKINWLSRGITQGIQEFLREPLIVFRLCPRSILQGVKDCGERLW